MASNAGESYIGSFVALISKSDIRYEGLVFQINTEKSTIALKNVRSFGTESRRKDGPQIPPSDKVYEYILFRGSDIKDLQVKNLPAQPEEHVHHDPAIIQSHYTGVTPTSSFTSVSGKTLVESAVVQSNPAEMSGVYSGLLPSYQIASHVAPTVASQANQNPVPSISLSMYWQGYNGTLIAGPGTSAQSISFDPQFVGSSVLPAQIPMSGPPGVNDSPIMGLTNASVSPASLPCVTSNHLHTTFIPPRVESHNSRMASSPSMITTVLPADPLYCTANELIKSSVSLPSEDAGRVEAPTLAKAISVSATVSRALPMPNSSLSFVGTTSNPLLPIPPSLLSPDQQAQSRLLPSIPMGYHDQRDTSTASANSVTFLPVNSSPASQEPLLPLPVSVQQIGTFENERLLIVSFLLFPEEFDFEAMNEKFKKHEVWGYLGKSKQIDERAVGEATDQSLEDKGSFGQPAYNKDDFFDTISRNTRTRGRNGQNCFSDRMKQDTETFGSSRRSNQGYGDYGTAHRYHNYGQQNWGRGYVYAGRARGRMQN